MSRANLYARRNRVKIKTSRFGELEVNQDDIIKFKDGILGFEQYKNFIVIDPSDSTLILWMQSLDNSQIAFPVIEPQIFKVDYCPVLMPNDMNALALENPADAKVYTILTIPSDFSQMSANLKAPIIVNSKKNNAKQVVLQDNKLVVKFEMYKDLKRAIANFSTSDDFKRTHIAPVKRFNPESESQFEEMEEIVINTSKENELD